MKITAPISRLEEIEPLAEAGTDEFYLGVVPAEWTERFNTRAVNRRIFGNLDSLEGLATAVAQIHALHRRVHLVLNAQHYSGEQLEGLLELAAQFDALGGDAVIVGDAALVALLGERGFGFHIHISSVATCRNAEAAAFYRDLGAHRIIFPRYVTLTEMAAIRERVSDLEYEAFILNDGCVFEEGVCHTIHLPGQMGGPICMDGYGYHYERIDGRPLKRAERERMETNEAAYKDWLWYRFGCGFSTTEEGYPYGPCGLCAVQRMAEAGIGTVKIAGREANTERKIRSVELVRRVFDRFDQTRAEQELMDYAQGLRDCSDRCATGYMCYYPEVLERAEPQELPVTLPTRKTG